IAASTMPGEEELVLDAFLCAREDYPTLKLVLAPRHPDRSGSVEAIVKGRRLEVTRRTHLSARSRSAHVLLLDTIGELAGLFQFASVVFVGGSLVAKGGHNILEPARHRKPIVFGPHMENFREMSSLFLQRAAAIQVDSAAQLAPTITRLLAT